MARIFAFSALSAIKKLRPDDQPRLFIFLFLFFFNQRG
jgi:hypothetical protein